LLTVTHHPPDRATLPNVASGWHAHLDILLARMTEKTPEPFWTVWNRLREQYTLRLRE
jgi:hypothetical protein